VAAGGFVAECRRLQWIAVGAMLQSAATAGSVVLRANGGQLQINTDSLAIDCNAFSFYMGHLRIRPYCLPVCTVCVMVVCVTPV